MLATRFIAPHLERFTQRYPELVVDLICTNRSLSLARQEADIALRLARPEEENLLVRRLSDITLALYASRAYIERHGAPADPDRSLAGHRVLLFADVRPFAAENQWFAPRLEGAHIALRSDSVSSLYSAAVGGVGFALSAATNFDAILLVLAERAGRVLSRDEILRHIDKITPLARAFA